jgi:hypothetical protein
MHPTVRSEREVFRLLRVYMIIALNLVRVVAHPADPARYRYVGPLD